MADWPIRAQLAAMHHDRFDEIDLDPTVPWRPMGTRQLGARAWLVADEGASAELLAALDA